MEETNRNLTTKLSFSELLVFIDVWLVILYSLPGGLNRREYWSLKEPSREDGVPFKLNNIMIGRWFEEIIQALSFASLALPNFKDMFWEIQEIVEVCT